MAKRINIKFILELHAGGLSQNQIAKTRHMSKASVSDVIKIATENDITFSDVREINDDELYQQFFPNKYLASQVYELPDYDQVHTEPYMSE